MLHLLIHEHGVKVKVLISPVGGLFQPHDCIPTRILCLWDFPGKNTGVASHFLLQVIFLTQGSNWSLLHLLHWQADSL